MKTFLLIVTFSATTGLIGGGRTERIASFDDYQRPNAVAGSALGMRAAGPAARTHWPLGSRFQPQGSPRWSAFHLL